MAIKDISKLLKLVLIEEQDHKNDALLTEEEVAMLIEARIDTIKEKNPVLSTEHDHFAEHKDAGAIIDHLANNADPTRNKAHTEYLVGQYKQGAIRQEDAPQIHATLSEFERVKSKLPVEQRQVTKKVFPTIGAIRTAIAPFADVVGKKSERNARSQERKAVLNNLDIPGKHELVLQHPEADVYELRDKETSKTLYGGGAEGKTESHPHATGWCTATRNEKENMFDRYTKDKNVVGQKGNTLLVFHRKSDGEIFQAHPITGQFQDRRNDEISFNDFGSIAGAVGAAHEKKLFDTAR